MSWVGAHRSTLESVLHNYQKLGKHNYLRQRAELSRSAREKTYTYNNIRDKDFSLKNL